MHKLPLFKLCRQRIEFRIAYFHDLAQRFVCTYVYSVLYVFVKIRVCVCVCACTIYVCVRACVCTEKAIRYSCYSKKLLRSCSKRECCTVLMVLENFTDTLVVTSHDTPVYVRRVSAQASRCVYLQTAKLPPQWCSYTHTCSNLLTGQKLYVQSDCVHVYVCFPPSVSVVNPVWHSDARLSWSSWRVGLYM